MTSKAWGHGESHDELPLKKFATHTIEGPSDSALTSSKCEDVEETFLWKVVQEE